MSSVLTSSAVTCIPAPAPTLNVLLSANVPPPVKPAPAVKSTASSVPILVVLLLTIPPMFASSFSAAANSLSVSSAAGAESTKLDTAVLTYDVDAAFVLLSVCN